MAKKYKENVCASVCKQGCPFYQCLHGHNSSAHWMACHYLLMTGMPHPAKCNLSEMQVKYQSLPKPKKSTAA